MQLIIDTIEAAVLEAQPDASFLHGTSFDVAVDNQIKDTTVQYVFLDPVRKNSKLSTGEENYPISIGFIKQDNADASPQEEDIIIAAMDAACLLFLQTLAENDLMQVDEYTIEPIRKIRNVCTGVLCTFNLITIRPC